MIRQPRLPKPMGSDDCTIEINDKFKQGNEKQLQLFCEKMEYQ